ncbi:hypothetical protein BU17DRAFT_35560 [Hysterangium stoloniferum]|nr:hypothetical protein BU17DRAFT_35560 [Hysterangium stoloniferum]
MTLSTDPPKDTDNELSSSRLGVKQESSQSSNRWYLAYGSNLSSKVFQGRRGIRPLACHVVRAPDLEVVFDLRGLPYWEPAFANVRQRTPSPKIHDLGLPNKTPIEIPSTTGTRELVGVVYLLTPQDYRTVIATEGGGNSYQEILVECFRMSSDLPEIVVSADSAVDPSSRSSSPESDPRILAYTLLAPNEVRSPTPLQPSKRYINILQAGAREHHLPADYIAYLDGITYYERATIRQKFGGVLFLAIWIIPLLMAVALNPVFADKKTGRLPGWLRIYQRFIRWMMWTNYNHLWKPLFGSGEVTSNGSNNAGITVPERQNMKLVTTAHIDIQGLKHDIVS